MRDMFFLVVEFLPERKPVRSVPCPDHKAARQSMAWLGNGSQPHGTPRHPIPIRSTARLGMDLYEIPAQSEKSRSGPVYNLLVSF